MKAGTATVMFPVALKDPLGSTKQMADRDDDWSERDLNYHC